MISHWKSTFTAHFPMISYWKSTFRAHFPMISYWKSTFTGRFQNPLFPSTKPETNGCLGHLWLVMHRMMMDMDGAHGQKPWNMLFQRSRPCVLLTKSRSVGANLAPISLWIMILIAKMVVYTDTMWGTQTKSPSWFITPITMVLMVLVVHLAIGTCFKVWYMSHGLGICFTSLSNIKIGDGNIPSIFLGDVKNEDIKTNPCKPTNLPRQMIIFHWPEVRPFGDDFLLKTMIPVMSQWGRDQI